MEVLVGMLWLLLVPPAAVLFALRLFNVLDLLAGQGHREVDFLLTHGGAP